MTSCGLIEDAHGLDHADGFQQQSGRGHPVGIRESMDVDIVELLLQFVDPGI